MGGDTTFVKMNFSDMDTRNNADLIPLGYGLSTIFSTIVMFIFLNKLFLSSLTNKPDSAIDKNEWQRRNLLISWIHALIVSVWDVTL